jgi:cytochrome c peroxidase
MKARLIAAAVSIIGLSTAFAAARNEPIQPIAPVKQINLAQAELGKKLYFDPRLSKSGFISCNSCHNLSMGGTDNIKTSIGHNWQEGPINAPTVLNSSLNVAQFWDGRAADLKATGVAGRSPTRARWPTRTRWPSGARNHPRLRA